MIHAIRILMIVLVIEVIIGIALLGLASWRTIPQLPEVELNDPLIMPQLREASAAAASGTAGDWTYLGEGLIGKGFYGHAELAFREALRLDPRNLDAQFGLAFSLDRTGRMHPSSQEYQKVLQIPSGSQEQERNKYFALYAMGRNALRQEISDEAEERFRQNAGFAPADYQLAKLLIRSGRADEARPLIEQKLAAIPYSLEFHFLDQRAYQQLKQPQAAFEAAAMVERSAYLVSMNFNTDYVAPLDHRIGIPPLVDQLQDAADRHDWDKVEQLGQEIQTLLGEAPVFLARHVNVRLLEAALQRKQPERALELVNQMRRSGREDAVTLEGEGDVRKMLGQGDQAAELWRRALSLTPSIGLHEKLAAHYGESDAAARDRHLSQISLMRGIEQYRSNRLKGAIPFLTKATNLAPQDASPWFYLGEIYFHLGDRKEALQAYKACLERQPSHGRAAAKEEFLKMLE